MVSAPGPLVPPLLAAVVAVVPLEPDPPLLPHAPNASRPITTTEIDKPTVRKILMASPYRRVGRVAVRPPGVRSPPACRPGRVAPGRLPEPGPEQGCSADRALGEPVPSTVMAEPSGPDVDPSPPFGPNAWLVEEMYERYRSDPASVSEHWQEF